MMLVVRGWEALAGAMMQIAEAVLTLALTQVFFAVLSQSVAATLRPSLTGHSE